MEGERAEFPFLKRVKRSTERFSWNGSAKVRSAPKRVAHGHGGPAAQLVQKPPPDPLELEPDAQ